MEQKRCKAPNCVCVELEQKCEDCKWFRVSNKSDIDTKKSFYVIREAYQMSDGDNFHVWAEFDNISYHSTLIGAEKAMKILIGNYKSDDTEIPNIVHIAVGCGKVMCEDYEKYTINILELMD